jgi:hypothetical protein
MFEAEVMALVAKHRQTGVVVDSNLLLVYLVGICDLGLMRRFKRTQGFSPGDFRLLVAFLAEFARILTTPGILVEVNSLANQLHERIKPDFYGVFKEHLVIMEERHVPSREVSQHTYFTRCGLTDAAIMTIAQQGFIVLTDDFRLTGLLEYLGIDCVNFNHLRAGQ